MVETLRAADCMLAAHKLVLHDLVLEVELEHLLVILLEHRVQHVREHVLLNQRLLLIGRLLLLERLKLFARLVLRLLDEASPDRFLIIEGSLMLHQEIIKLRPAGRLD